MDIFSPELNPRRFIKKKIFLYVIECEQKCLRARTQWRAFGGAVAVPAAVSVCMLASVERPASTENTWIQARVFVMRVARTAPLPTHHERPLRPQPKCNKYSEDLFIAKLIWLQLWFYLYIVSLRRWESV